MLHTEGEAARAPFVGRVLELEELSSHLDFALRGHPRLVLLRGEAGVGKTRLLRELTTIAERLGVRIARGRAMEGAATPLLPFIQLLEVCTNVQHPQADAMALLTARISPSAAGSLPRDAAHEAARNFGSVVREVVAFAKREPLLVVLDDLHWADASSLELLGQLLFTLAESVPEHSVPLLLAAAHRPVPPSHSLGKVVARLRREHVVHSLELEGLAVEETRALLSGLGLGHVTERLVDSVQNVTHGYPLFVQELLHQLEQLGLLERTAHATTVKAIPVHAVIPRDVSDALSQRLIELDQAEVRLLTLSALVGDNISLERMARVAGVERAALILAFERALRAELMVVEAGALRFRHPLIRELLAARAGPLERPELHRQIAQRLEAEPASGALSLEIAEHLLAAHSDEPRKLRQHARRGADHAFAMFAWAQAGRLYAVAAEAASGCPETSAYELGELHSQGGIAFSRAFDHAASLRHFGEAARAFARAGDLVKRAHMLRLRLRAQYQAGSVRYGDLLDLSEHEQVLSELGESELATQAVVLEALAQAHWLGCQTAQAEQHARRAFAIGERLGDEDVQNQANFMLGLILWQAGKTRSALQHFNACLVHWKRLEDAWPRVLPLQRMCALQLTLGELVEAEQLCDEASRLAQEVQYISELSFLYANRATLSLARGQLAAVQQHAARSIALGKRASYGYAGLQAVVALARARALQGEHDDALYAIQLLERPGEIFDEPTMASRSTVALWRSLIHAFADGRTPDQASRDRLTRYARAVTQGPLDTNAAFILCMLIEGAGQLQHSAGIELAHERLTRLFEAGSVMTSIGAYLLPRVLAIGSRLLGDEPAAERYAEQAVAIAERVGAALELGLALMEHASWLAPRPSEREHAALLARRASEVFAELGLAAAQKADIMSVPSAILDVRERHLLHQIAHGRSYSQIADELLLGPERVVALAEALYTRLDLDGPGLATAYAFAYGIADQRNVAAVQQPRIVMVTDMVDFTGAVRRLGDLRARSLMHVHNRVIRRLLSENHGSELAHTGDGVIAAFQSCRDALDCAVGLQLQLAAYSVEHPQTPIRVRIGCNAGQLVQHGDTLFGAALIAAVRICSRAQATQILLSASVYALADHALRARTSSMGSVVLKGFDEPVEVHELRYQAL